MTVGAHFDGRVFVPDGPIDLPVGRRVRVIFDPAAGPDLEAVSPVVRDYCAAHGLAGPVADLQRLARESMTGLTGVLLRVESDPESGESWLVVEAQVPAGTPTFLADYDAVLRQWVEATEPRARDRVCFTFALA